MAEPFAITQCGAVTCLAGHINLIVLKKAQKAGDITVGHRSIEDIGKCPWMGIIALAAIALDIDKELAERLFYLSNWCKPFQERYIVRMDEVEALTKSLFGKAKADKDSLVFYNKINEVEENNPAKFKLKQAILNKKQEMAEIACERLDHFVKTGR
ncbi:MAG: hypothetical protein WBB28_02155 [Crinalium sp.]